MKAVLVLGAASSGTKMITEAFVRLGFHGGYEYAQELDDLDFLKAIPRDLVFRRSYPHGLEWPDAADILMRLTVAGYHEIAVVAVIRNGYSTARSQASRGHSKDAVAAETSIDYGVDLLFTQIATWGIYPHVVVYEPFVRDARVREAFFRRLDLPVPPMNFRDENQKYKS